MRQVKFNNKEYQYYKYFSPKNNHRLTELSKIAKKRAVFYQTSVFSRSLFLSRSGNTRPVVWPVLEPGCGLSERASSSRVALSSFSSVLPIPLSAVMTDRASVNITTLLREVPLLSRIISAAVLIASSSAQ